MSEELDNWEYDGVRVGRATRTAEVDAPDGTNTIEEGTVRFDPIDAEDTWLWEEDEWLEHYVSPDGGVGLDGGVVVPHDKLGIIDLPEPMTRKEIHEYLKENPEEWRPLLDETLECDVTGEDLGIPPR